MNQTEQDLIRRAQSADTDAFCRLAERYDRRIYSLALHYCQDQSDAEDLSQEVWLKAYQGLSSFRGDSNFYTWLRRITINCFLNHQRSLSHRLHQQLISVQFLSEEPGEKAQPAEHGDSETTLHNHILAKRVHGALVELSSQQRLIFLLKHHEGMTYEEIASHVGCSVGTAKKSVARAVTKLRQQLEVEVDASNYIPCPAVEY